MKIRRLALIALFLLSSLGLRAETPSTIDALVYASRDGRTMPYRIFIPANYDTHKQYPLVLCLHGAGGRGSDNTSRGTEAFTVLSSPEVQKDHPCFLLTPQCPEGKTWVKTPWTKGSYSIDAVPLSDEMHSALDILFTVKSEFSIDPARIYVTGQSMGGYGTWDAVLRCRKVFAAAVPVCGAGDPSKAKLIAHVPLWIFHGSDDPTVPVQGSRDMVKALTDAGSTSFKFTEYPGIKHDSWTKAWKEKDLVPWLFAQHLPAAQNKRAGPFDPARLLKFWSYRLPSSKS